MHYISKIFQFADCDCFGIIWLVTDAFILLTVHDVNFSSICFPSHPYNNAGKTVYSSLTFVLVEAFSLL